MWSCKSTRAKGYWLYGQDLLMISHHPAMSSRHRNCGSKDDDEWWMVFGEWLTNEKLSDLSPTRPPSNILTIATIRHSTSRIWTCAEHYFTLCRMDLCSCFNLYTRASVWRVRFHMPLVKFIIIVLSSLKHTHAMFSLTRFQDLDTIFWQCVQWRTFDICYTCVQQQLTQIT